jgi:hypothetical protein
VRRVVAVNRYYWPDTSATSQHLADLAEQLSADGVDVTVVTSRNCYSDPDRNFPAWEQKSGVRIYRVWTTSIGRAWLPGRAVDYLTFYLFAFFKLFALVRRGDTVIAKTDPPMISVVAALVTRFRGAHLVNWCQDLFPEVAGALGMQWVTGWGGKLLRSIRNFSLREAQLNVVLSQSMRDIVHCQGVATKRIKVLHNWADSAVQPALPGENPLREEWCLGNKVAIGYSGNLGRAHCSDSVLELVRQTLPLGEPSWLFVGGGCGMERLKADPEIRTASDRVLFQPYQDRSRLSQSLAVPDLHLLTQDPACEGLILPSKLYGILAAGRGIVFLGDPDGEVARIIRQYAIGLVLDVNRPETWIPKITQLIENRSVIESYGRQARCVFQARYGTAQALRAWTRCLQQVGDGEDAGIVPASQTLSGMPSRAYGADLIRQIRIRNPRQQ